MSLSDTHHTDESDVTLIERARAGDVDAFGVLHLRHVGSAQALARRMSRSTADADDLVSEGFARVLGALQRGKGPDVAFRPYLLSTIRRLAYDRTSREQREAPIATDDGPEVALPVGDPVVDGFERDTAASAFASLPERWRMVLWHTEVEGQSPAEVGALLGMNPNAVAALAYRAREGLRQAYLTEHAPRASTSKECELTTSRLGAYVRGGLTPSREARLRKHLDDCGDCQAAYLELASVNTAMPAIVVFAVLGPVGGAYLASVLGPSLTATTALLAGMSPVLQGGAGRTGAAAGGSTTGAAAGAGTGSAGSMGSSSATTGASIVRAGANARYVAAAAAVVVVLAAIAAIAAFAGSDPATTTATRPVGSDATQTDVAPILGDPTPTPAADLTDPTPSTSPPRSPFDLDPTTSPRPPGPSPRPPDQTGPTGPGTRTPFAPPAPEPEPPTPSTPTTSTTVVPTTSTPISTTTTTPITEPPEPANLAVELSSAGVLVRDRPGVIVARITNTGGGPGTRSRLVFELTGARLRGLPQTPAGQRGSLVDSPRSNARGDRVGAWSCEPIDTDAMSCTAESVEAGASSTLYVPVDVDGSDAPVEIRADVGSTGNSARRGPSSVTTLPVEPTGMAARFATIDRGAIVTTGNTLLTCDPQDPRCTESLAGGAGALDNGSFAMIPVDVDDDPATANSSGADLALTADAEVLSATLYWSAGLGAGPGGTPAPAPDRRGEAVLTGPDGVSHAVVAERVDDIATDQRYQTLADVTELVRRGGAGHWTFGGAQIGTGTNTYGGWSLIVAYRDTSLPKRSLVVLDGFAAVNDSDTVSFTVGGFLVPDGGSTGAMLDVVTYEGDHALLGDQLSVNGVALSDASNPLGNSFNSSSSDRGQPTSGRNPSWGNLLGIDLDRFDVTEVLSPGSTSTTISFSTAADRYLTGAVALSIDQ